MKSFELKLARELEIRVDPSLSPAAVAQPEDESDLSVESWLQMRPPFEDLFKACVVSGRRPHAGAAHTR